MFRAVLLDDEFRSNDLMENLIRFWLKEITEVIKFQHQDKAKSYLETNHVDLLFQDIQMPGQNGFEFLQNLDCKIPPGIFVTAHDTYAIQALRLSALDYLLKPLDPDELVSAFNRFKQLNLIEHQAKISNGIKNIVEQDIRNMRIFIPGNGGIQFYPLEQIVRCEAQSNYTEFHFSNGRKKVSSKTMKEYVKVLKPYNFIRVHKSHLINASFIDKIRNRNEIILSDSSTIPIARRRKDEVLKFLQIKT